MAKAILPTNFTDDVLNESMDGKRRYNMIPNADGSQSLEDVTAYDQLGSNFGASNINAMNQAINESFDKNKMISDMDELDAVTQSGYGVDALLVKEVNESLNSKTAVIIQNFQQGDSVSYPDGFTMDNCVIVSVMGYYSENQRWLNCFNANDMGSDFLHLSLRPDNIYCDARFAPNGFTNFKVVLQKIS